MYMFICGTGKVCTSLVSELHNDHHITVIDLNQENLAKLNEEYDVKTVFGNASHLKVLEEAGIGNADIVISILPSDDSNLFICRISDIFFNVSRKIAKISDINFLPHHTNILNSFSVDDVISPGLDVANYIYNLTVGFDLKEKISIFSGDCCIMLTSAKKASLQDIQDDLADLGMLFLCALRNGKILSNNKIKELTDNDELLFITKTATLHNAVNILKTKADKKSVIIIGGGDVGFSLAKQLIQIDFISDVALIENNARRAKYLAEQLDGVNSINGSGIDDKILQELNIDEKTIVISVTDSDQANIFSQLLLQNFHSQESCAIIQDPSYVKLAQSLKVGHIVLPHFVTSQNFANLIKKSVQETSIMRVHYLYNNLLIFIEIKLKDDKTIKVLSEIPREYIIKVIFLDKNWNITTCNNYNNLSNNDSILLWIDANFSKKVTSYFY